MSKTEKRGEEVDVFYPVSVQRKSQPQARKKRERETDHERFVGRAGEGLVQRLNNREEYGMTRDMK